MARNMMQWKEVPMLIAMVVAVVLLMRHCMFISPALVSCACAVPESARRGTRLLGTT